LTPIIPRRLSDATRSSEPRSERKRGRAETDEGLRLRSSASWVRRSHGRTVLAAEPSRGARLWGAASDGDLPRLREGVLGVCLL
jgi:hypothetical protein